MKTKTLIDNINDVDECLTHILIEINVASGEWADHHKALWGLRETFRNVTLRLLKGEQLTDKKNMGAVQ